MPSSHITTRITAIVQSMFSASVQDSLSKRCATRAVARSAVNAEALGVKDQTGRRVHSTKFQLAPSRASLQVLPNDPLAAGTLLAERSGNEGPFMPHALIVDDDTTFQEGLAQVVEREGFTAATAATLADARAELAHAVPDAVLLDLNLPDGSGMELLEELSGNGSPEVILIKGQASLETAIEALRRGAADYLTKPVDFTRVKQVLANLSRTRELKKEIGSLRGELRKLGRFGPLIGSSEGMQRLYDFLPRIAASDASVLVLGETGTGKDLVAQAIHSMSRRAKEAFVPVNCGAVSPTLIESELFGHERGSFTGADRSNRGSLFLDEITEMPPELQVKLLRVLETGTLNRVGGTDMIHVDIRVIAATNRRPDEAVSAGKLREDLLYRLNVLPVELPPLRERRDDIELLAEHFIDELNKESGSAKRFTTAALQRLRTHSWPGNVRELRNVIHRAYILAENDIVIDALPLGVIEDAPGASGLMLK